MTSETDGVVDIEGLADEVRYVELGLDGVLSPKGEVLPVHGFVVDVDTDWVLLAFDAAFRLDGWGVYPRDRIAWVRVGPEQRRMARWMREDALAQPLGPPLALRSGGTRALMKMLMSQTRLVALTVRGQTRGLRLSGRIVKVTEAQALVHVVNNVGVPSELRVVAIPSITAIEFGSRELRFLADAEGGGDGRDLKTSIPETLGQLAIENQYACLEMADGDEVRGFVVDTGPEWVMLAAMDRFALDGWRIVRISDVVAVFLGEVERTQGAWLSSQLERGTPRPSCSVDLGSTVAVASSLMSAGVMVYVEGNAEKSDYIEVGRILRADGLDMTLRTIGIDAVWSEEEDSQLADVGLFSFGGRYEEGLGRHARAPG